MPFALPIKTTSTAANLFYVNDFPLDPCVTYAAVAPKISFIFAVVHNLKKIPIAVVSPTVIQIRTTVLLTWSSQSISSAGKSEAIMVADIENPILVDWINLVSLGSYTLPLSSSIFFRC